ncbi:MAG TPA: dephospho-CoA kinase [Chitinophagaceae bacterium]|nr:dephospho-CoA kinase [Chitinophagaceae bacterium]
MLRIGLTGGLGSGKSTIAHIFEVLGIPVYYADASSKKLMNEDGKVKAAVKNAFGKEVYPEGKLDRKYLAEIVFKDEKKLELLNSIVHPATLHDAAEWMKQQTSPYAIKEAALIFESGADKSLDYVIGVKSPLELRLQRTLKRDNISKDQAMARINQQMDEEAKINLCNFVIMNDEKQMVIPQVLEIHHKILDLCKVQN